MKKILIITAHPSSLGHTHRIANAYKDVSLEKGHQVVIHDLYKSEHQIPYLTFENPKVWPDLPELKFFQDEVLWADEIVFVHPVWWGAPPAIMKNWIDHIFQSHFAYKYENGKPVGLLKGKCAKVFATSGGPAIIYNFFLSPFRLTWGKAVNGFCGINTKTVMVFGNASKKDAEDSFLLFLKKIKENA